MLKEGKRKREGLAYPLHAFVNRLVEFGKLFGAPIGEFLSLDVAPLRFQRVPIRSATWQSLHGEAMPLAV